MSQCPNRWLGRDVQVADGRWAFTKTLVKPRTSGLNSDIVATNAANLLTPLEPETPRVVAARPDVGTRVPRAGVADIAALAEKAASIIAQARVEALSPESRKTLRGFSLKEAADLIGVSTKTLQRALKDSPELVGQRLGGNRLRLPLDVIHLAQDRLGRSPARNPATDPAAILAIANFKGGVGKTSTAVHLAQYFALHGYRVLAVDLDAQASLTTAFGLLPDTEVPEEATALPYLEGSAEGLSVQRTYWPRLDLIPANLGLYGAEFALANRQSSEANFRFYRCLQSGLAPLLPNYDIVIIDTPPSLSFVTMNALFAATGILVPVPPAMMDFASANLFFTLLTSVLTSIDQSEGEPKTYDFLGLLISMYKPGNFVHQTIHDWVRAAFQNRVLSNPIVENAALRVGPEMLSAYELTSKEANRETLRRALEVVNNANSEIERLVRAQWASARPRLAASRREAAAP